MAFQQPELGGHGMVQLSYASSSWDLLGPHQATLLILTVVWSLEFPASSIMRHDRHGQARMLDEKIVDRWLPSQQHELAAGKKRYLWFNVILDGSS